MKKASIIILVFLIFLFTGCSNNIDKDAGSKKINDDKNEEILQSKSRTLEDDFKKLQNDLKKEEGYVLNEKNEYEIDEANGLKYIYGIEKQTDYSYELYEISVYFNEGYAIHAENQWDKTKITNNDKKIGIYISQESDEIYYTYRKNNMIINIGGYGNDKMILKVMKKYFKIDL